MNYISKFTADISLLPKVHKTMSMTPPKNIIIIGGGNAGWMSASLLQHAWANAGCNITVIDSADIAQGLLAYSLVKP